MLSAFSRLSSPQKKHTHWTGLRDILQESFQLNGKKKHGFLRWMEEILHHLGWLKPYKQWDTPSINWCRISSIHRSFLQIFALTSYQWQIGKAQF